MSDNPLSPILRKKAARKAAIQAKVEAALAEQPLLDRLRSAQDAVAKTLQDLLELSHPTAEDYAKVASLLANQLAAVWDALTAVQAIGRIAEWRPWPDGEGAALQAALARRVSADHLGEALPALNARNLSLAWDDFRQYLWPNDPVSVRDVVEAFEIGDHRRECATADRQATPTGGQAVEPAGATGGAGGEEEPPAPGRQTNGAPTVAAASDRSEPAGLRSIAQQPAGHEGEGSLTDGEETDTPRLPTTAPLSAPELARLLGQGVDAVDSFLRRYRTKYPDCFVTLENDDRRRNEAKIRYRVSEVWPALLEHFRREPKTTGG
jgi:hypothetical protein